MLDDEQQLRKDDHDEHPALEPQSLTLGVSHVCVVLPDAGGTPQSQEQDPHHADRVLRRHREEVLDKEGVQLYDLPDEHK